MTALLCGPSLKGGEGTRGPCGSHNTLGSRDFLLLFLLREQEAGDGDEAARGPQERRQEGQSKPAGQQPQRNLQKPLKSHAVCPGQAPALSSVERPPTGQQGLWVHNGAGLAAPQDGNVFLFPPRAQIRCLFVLKNLLSRPPPR